MFVSNVKSSNSDEKCAVKQNKTQMMTCADCNDL